METSMRARGSGVAFIVTSILSLSFFFLSMISASYVHAAIAAPSFSVAGGVYQTMQQVSLGTTAAGATICFTIDGTDPTTSGAGVCNTADSTKTYHTAITVSVSQTIKAIATGSGNADSAIASAEYIVIGIQGPISHSGTLIQSLSSASVASPAVTHTEGNLIAVYLSGKTAASTDTLRVEDTQGNVYAGIGTAYNSWGYKSQWFYTFATGSGSNTVTGTFKNAAGTNISATDRTIRVLEYSNIDTTAPVDVHVSGEGAANLISKTFETRSADELILASWDTETGACAAGTGYTLLPDDFCGTGISRPVEQRIVSSLQPSGTTATINDADGSTSGRWVVSFRAALAVPQFSVDGGTYDEYKSVALSTTDSAARICYTLDGSTPAATAPGICDGGSTRTYSGMPISITTSKTIKALSTSSGYKNSGIVSATYTINIASGVMIAPAKPKIIGNSISFSGNQDILSFSVLNAIDIALSATPDFAGISWEAYDATRTYTGSKGQAKAYARFRSSAGGYSEIIEVDLTGGSSLSRTDGTLFKLPDSPKIYVMIGGKKKWIPTPEAFEQSGYEWTDIAVVTPAQSDAIADYEDNLLRAKGNYKVYLVADGLKRHIPNADIFRDYGFDWGDIKDVDRSVLDGYEDALFLRETGTTAAV